MDKIIAIIKTLSALYPLVIQIIDTVEKVLPNSTVDTKLEAIKVSLQGAHDKLGGIETTFESVWPPLQGVIAGIMALRNHAEAVKT